MKSREIERLLNELRRLAAGGQRRPSPFTAMRVEEILAQLRAAAGERLDAKVEDLEHSFAHLFGTEAGVPPDRRTWTDWVYQDCTTIELMLRTRERWNAR